MFKEMRTLSFNDVPQDLPIFFTSRVSSLTKQHTYIKKFGEERIELRLVRFGNIQWKRQNLGLPWTLEEIDPHSHRGVRRRFPYQRYGVVFNDTPLASLIDGGSSEEMDGTSFD